MAFTGELEHLSIIDVIQLLHSTRKSGILSVNGEKGESRIVFSEGHIVSANYLNSRVRVGKILVKMGVLTEADLEEALEAQKNAGENRKPLIATLIESGKIKQEDAHKGLKKLVEMTVVELVDWTSGTFTLDTEPITASDQISYQPGQMEQEISLDAQLILMDALRIFDEKQRDGKSKDLLFSDEELAEEGPPSPPSPEDAGETAGPAAPAQSTGGTVDITADALGLADLDKLERKIPEVFSSIKVFDPTDIHYQSIMEMLPDFSDRDQKKLASFLAELSVGAKPEDGAGVQADQTRSVILFSSDQFIRHSVMTVCKNLRILVYATDGRYELDYLVDKCLSNKIIPIIFFDIPEKPSDSFSEDKIIKLQKKVKEKNPNISTIQLAAQPDYDFSLHTFDDRIESILPKPSRELRRETFTEDIIKFLEAFHSYLQKRFLASAEPDYSRHN